MSAIEGRSATVRARWLVAASCVLSAAAYLAFSQEHRSAMAAGGYQRALITQFLAERGLRGVHLWHAVQPSGVVLLALTAGICAVSGVAMSRLLGGRGARFESLTFATAIMLLPAMALATAFWPDGRGMLSSANLAAGSLSVGVLATLGAWHARRRGCACVPARLATRDPDQGDTVTADRAWALVLLVALVPLLIGIWWNGIDAIRGFDSLADHLPRAARWLRLSRLAEESGPLLTSYYPGNFQLLVRWALVLGTDAFAFVPSLCGAVLAIAALYGICRELGQSRWTAIISAVSASSCSVLAFLATTVEADTVTTAFLLIAVLLLLRWLRRVPPLQGHSAAALAACSTLIAVGTSLGIAIGTKYSALPSVFIIGCVAASGALRRSQMRLPNRSTQLNLRTLVILLACLVIPMVAMGGFWYFRNLLEHGNPMYPLAVLGLPGVDISIITPVKPALLNSTWARVTYPWVGWDFVSVYDDPLGLCFASLAVVGFLACATRLAGATARPRRTLWLMTLGAYLLWLGSGSLTARFGLLPILLTYAFVGEMWREFGGLPLRIATTTLILFTIAVTTRSMVVGAVYTTVMPPGRRGVPEIVDRLPPTRIFNATSASNRYRLLGADYRHEVITMFSSPTLADRDSSHAQYVLLGPAQLAALSVGARLVGLGPPSSSGERLSLWRLGNFRDR